MSKGYELLYVTMLILLTTVFMKSSIGARFENHILINVPNASPRNQNVRGVICRWSAKNKKDHGYAARCKQHIINSFYVHYADKFIYTYAIVSRNNIKVCTFLLIK